MIHEGAQADFQTTRWSRIRQAAGSQDTHDVEARSAFCIAYWYPIYAFIRRSGYQPQDAEDHTQSFFVRLVERDLLAVADPDKGRLRSFLLTCAQNYLRDEQDRAAAKKRGAGLIVHLDGVHAEERYAREAVDHLSPDRLYQRQWALTLLKQSLAELETEYQNTGKAALIEGLRPFLGFRPEPDGGHEKIAATLGMPKSTFASHLRRARARWSEIVRTHVADTLAEPTPEAIRSELTELLGYV